MYYPKKFESSNKTFSVDSSPIPYNYINNWDYLEEK